MALTEVFEVVESQAVGFVLVLARLGPIFVFAPVFSSRLIPLKAKAILAGALAVAIAPVATGGQALPTDPATLAALLGKEIVVGLGYALAIGILSASVQAAGSLVDTLVGFSFSAIVDPMSGGQGAVLGQLYSIFAAMVFLLTGGDQIVIRGLAASYEVIGLEQVPSLASLGALGLEGLARIFTIAVAIAAPVILALLVVEAGLALVARAAPQMNVFFVGLPGKIIVGIGAVAASLPFVAGHVHAELEGLVRVGLTAITPG